MLVAKRKKCKAVKRLHQSKRGGTVRRHALLATLGLEMGMQTCPRWASEESQLRLTREAPACVCAGRGIVRVEASRRHEPPPPWTAPRSRPSSPLPCATSCYPTAYAPRPRANTAGCAVSAAVEHMERGDAEAPSLNARRILTLASRISLSHARVPRPRPRPFLRLSRTQSPATRRRRPVTCSRRRARCTPAHWRA